MKRSTTMEYNEDNAVGLGSSRRVGELEPKPRFKVPDRAPRPSRGPASPQPQFDAPRERGSWLRDLNLGRRIAISLAVIVLSLTGLALFIMESNSKVNVGGPVFQEVATSKDLIADILPPPAFIIEAFLTIHELADETDKERIRVLTERVARLQKEYAERLQFWESKVPAGPLREALLRESSAPVQSFFAAYQSQMLPAMARGDNDMAREVTDKVLKAKYLEHRAAIDKAVGLANKAQADIEQQALRAVSRTQFLSQIAMAVVGIFAVFAGVALTRTVTKPVLRMKGELDRIGQGDTELRLTVDSRNEVGRIGESVNVVLDQVQSEMEKNAEFASQIQALQRSQAVIEFELDGTILNANENFLRTVGYRLEEIKGKHHSMFMDSAEAATAEYRQFWRELADGKFQSGQFKRVGQGGKIVWIQASYNPIFDLNKRPYKVVKFATDITEQKAAEYNSRRQIEEISRTQATIEFTCDGTIVTANENFLSCLGYRLDEIKGRHHSMFVDPAYRDSSEYRQFWRDLNDGKWFLDVFSGWKGMGILI